MVKYMAVFVILIISSPISYTDNNKTDIDDLAFIMESHASNEVTGFVAQRGASLTQTNELALAGMLAILFYQGVLSEQSPPGCPFYPSCSQYGLLAVKKYGFVIGVLMASDRLQRCNGHGAGLYPIHRATGKLYDPPERNHL